MAKTTHDFVKKTGRDKHWAYLYKELEGLMDPKTGELKKELSKYVACAVCGSKKNNLSFMKKGFRFVKCCRCGLLFVNPQVDDTRIIKSYSQDKSHDNWVDVLLSKNQQEYDAKHRFGEAIRRLEKKYPKKTRGELMDIGCSVGLFMKLARDKGWTPRGLEINLKAKKYATDVLKLPVEAKLLHEIDYPKNSFQVMSLWGVLEHTSHPADVLRQARPFLHKKGTLVILVPNGHSLKTRILHENAATFSGRNHLWYFTPDTITRLLKKTGYKVTDMYTQLPQIHQILDFMNYTHPYIAGLPQQTEELKLTKSFEKQLEKYILKNHLGYKLIVFAEKV